MELITIAKPYANAVFEVANKHSNFKDWQALLTVSAQIVAESKMKSLIASPAVTKQEKIKLTLSLLNLALGRELNKEEKAFVTLMFKNMRTNLFDSVLFLFEQKINQLEDTKVLDVISAYELSTAEQQQLIGELSKKYEAMVSVNIQIDKQLVGGLIVKDGDKVIDISIKARTNDLGSCLLTTH
jgi:F-type H+-transporting ATPase subunit delta